MVGRLSVDGVVRRVSGPLVEATLTGASMGELVWLGRDGLPAEVVAVDQSSTTLQAYEYTGGLAVGDPVRRRGHPLSAQLGPHLLGGVFDGLLQPLDGAGTWLAHRGPRSGVGTAWPWMPSVAVGDRAGEGAVLGEVAGPGLRHRVLVPLGCGGVVEEVAAAGERGLDHVVATVSGRPVRLAEHWPVRRPRPFLDRLPCDRPLTTGQRVLDALFPVSLGGTAAVPGGFGTGKTVLLQQLAKWSAADVIVYVGCGERGNELADVLDELRALSDPRTGRALAERTVIVANTSDMPLMAREASVHTGVTVAEYFRDMGYDAVVIADSTSRWAEALREFVSRSGAVPGEEGFPASLSSQLAAFYERAGRVRTVGDRTGSVTIVGAVSPPGGDITEPVTSHTERFVRTLWRLDRALAYGRRYPAVSWGGSFCRDAPVLAEWHARQGDPGWGPRRARIASLLAQADRLADLSELVGVGALPARERMVSLGARVVREGVLQQGAQGQDAHCTPAKTRALVEGALQVLDAALHAVDRGVPADRVEQVDLRPFLGAAADTGPDDAEQVRGRTVEVARRLEEV